VRQLLSRLHDSSPRRNRPPPAVYSASRGVKLANRRFIVVPAQAVLTSDLRPLLPISDLAETAARNSRPASRLAPTADRRGRRRPLVGYRLRAVSTTVPLEAEGITEFNTVLAEIETPAQARAGRARRPGPKSRRRFLIRLLRASSAISPAARASRAPPDRRPGQRLLTNRRNYVFRR
jgi:hypothetical protein